MTSVEAIKAARLLEAVTDAYRHTAGPVDFLKSLHDEGFQVVAIPPVFAGKPPEPPIFCGLCGRAISLSSSCTLSDCPARSRNTA